MTRLLVLLLLIATVQCEFNCTTCECDKTSVICRNVNDKIEELKSEQIKLNSDTTSVKLVHVPVNGLTGYVFHEAKLDQLTELYIIECKMETIDKSAFKNLFELKKLNAYNNKISYLPVGIFEDNYNLEQLNFDSNNIEVLENGLFDNLTLLTKLKLSSNKIANIGGRIFEQNLNLEVMELSRNLLTTINGTMLRQLRKIKKVVAHSNPWTCDCNIRPLQILTLKTPYEVMPKCENALNLEYIKSIKWSEISDRDFKCNATLNFFKPIFSPDLYSAETSLECNIMANPPTLFGKIYKNNETDQPPLQRYVNDVYTSFYRLTFSDITDEVNNTYTCYVLSNSGYNLTETIVMKDVYQEYLINRKELKYKYDTTKSFKCTRFENTATQVQWYFNNKTITRNKKYEIHTRGLGTGVISILDVNNWTYEDYGDYKCTNLDGNDEQIFNEYNIKITEFEVINLNKILTAVVCVIAVIFILLVAFAVWHTKYTKRKQIEANIASMTAPIRGYNAYNELPV